MRAFLGFLSFIFLLGCKAQLFGLTKDVELVEIDPITYYQQPIGRPLNDTYAQAAGVSAIDTKQNIFYVVGLNRVTGSYDLVGISLVDGSVALRLELPFAKREYIGLGQYVDVDVNTGDVIVAGHTTTDGTTHQIFRIVPNTQNITQLGEFDGKDMIGGRSAIDYVNGSVYYEHHQPGKEGYVLVRFDLNSGQVESAVAVQYYLQTLEFDPKTGLIVGFGLDENLYRVLVKYDPSSQEFTKGPIIPDYGVLLNSLSAIDVQERRLFGLLRSNGTTGFLVSVDIDSGTLVTSAPACEEILQCVKNIVYL